MEDIWQRIEKWFQDNEPSFAFKLRDGASEKDLRKIEAFIETRFPPDLRESYALHDENRGAAFFPQGDLLSLDRIYDWEFELWGILRDDPYKSARTNPEGPIKPLYWNLLWVPFINDGDCQICVDLDPAAGGSVGQMIERFHGGGPTRVLANSFRCWLSGYADDLEGGRISFESGEPTRNE